MPFEAGVIGEIHFKKLYLQSAEVQVTAPFSSISTFAVTSGLRDEFAPPSCGGGRRKMLLLPQGSAFGLLFSESP